MTLRRRRVHARISDARQRRLSTRGEPCRLERADLNGMTNFKLGKLDPDPTKKALLLGPHLTGALTPPAQRDWLSKVTNWPMYGNDQFGCCIIEGTEVQADGVERGYRVRYDGPVRRLGFASGRVLTVTPNHAVLTPRGFVRARLLQKGDDAIRTLRPQMLEGGTDFNDTPTAIEEIFATLSRSGTTTRQRTQSRLATGPDDFHGDARFFDGDVEVVDALGLLERQGDTALRQPHGEGEIRAAGELEGDLHGPRATFKAATTRGSSTLRRVGSSSDLGALGDRHAGVAQAERVTLRSDRSARLNEQATESRSTDACLSSEGDPALPSIVALKERRQHRPDVSVTAGEGGSDTIKARRELVASVLHPSSDGGSTDAQLAADLLERFPGLVEADRLIDIHEEWYHGYVYDLSTARRWYVANEIVVHNCVFAAIGHMIEAWTAFNGKQIEVTTADLLHAYSAVTGFDPQDPSTDQGTVLQDALDYWRRAGIAGHKILAFAKIDHTNPDEIKAALDTFGGLMIGIKFPRVAMTQFDAGQPWDVVAHDGGIEGGHAIHGGAYELGEMEIVTWAKVQTMTDAFTKEYVDEAWAVITPEWYAVTGRTPGGVDLTGLGEAMSRITGEPNPFPPTPPVPSGDPDQTFAAALRKGSWVTAPHLAGNARIAKAARAWLQAKGI